MNTPSNPIVLNTATTQLVLTERNSVWSIAHYGERVANVEDALLLDLLRWNVDDEGKNHAESYAPFGGDRGEFTKKACGMNKFAALTAKHANGCCTTYWKGDKAERVADAAGVDHVVLHLTDRAYPFHARQHFRAIYDVDVIETWVELEHEEAAPVEISRMASFGIDFSNLADHFHVLSLSGQWACEAVVSEMELVRGQKISLGSRSGVRGAWDNNPAFMLSIGDRADEENGRVIGGALAWSGAWEISFQHAHNHDLRIFAGVDNISGPYVLDPGKVLTLPKFSLTYSATGKGAVSRAFHRYAREWLMPHGKTTRDVLLNSWEGAYMDFDEKVLTDMMDGVVKLGGEMFVIDDGWFGMGKNARNTDTTGLGDWFWNTEKLPKGLAYLVKEANSRGLKLGLWFEPEMANTKSDLVEAHPDWVIREKDRPLREGRGGTQVILDMTNPAVRDAIFDQIDAVIRSAEGLAYIKWDANANFMNAGSAYLDDAHQANIWFDYTMGVYELFARLRAAHPDIVFQACSSGGGHADFSWLTYADEIWGSDNSCAQQRIFIQWGEELFYPASCVGAHVTVVPNHQTHRMAPLKYRFDVAFSGRLGFELHPVNMTEEEVEFAVEAVKAYKRNREVIQQGDLYRLRSPYGNDHAALEFVSRDASRAMLMVYGQTHLHNIGNPPPLRLRALDAAKRYRITEINKQKNASGHIGLLDGAVLSGDALMRVGITGWLADAEDSFVLEITEEV